MKTWLTCSRKPTKGRLERSSSSGRAGRARRICWVSCRLRGPGSVGAPGTTCGIVGSEHLAPHPFTPGLGDPSESSRDTWPETAGGQNSNPWSLVPRPIEPPMSHDSPVVRRQVEIVNALGLHMRPADKFVKLAPPV